MYMRKELAWACVAAFVGLAIAFYALPATPEEPVVRIVAKRFNYIPGAVTIKKGVPVVFELTSEDVLMGFTVPDLDLRAEIVPGKATRVRVVPQKTGTFVFLCDIFCGVGHEEMNGKVTVVE